MKIKTSTSKNVANESKLNPTVHSWIGAVFFDVPVYRLTEEEYERDKEEYVQKELSGGGHYTQELYRREPRQKDWMEKRLRQKYGGCWLFNEIVGFIRLRFRSSQIIGEYWRVNAKKLTRTRKKTFAFREPTVTYAQDVPPGNSTSEIFDLILNYLARAQKEKHLKACYIDKEVFEFIGAYVDWKALFTRQPK